MAVAETGQFQAAADELGISQQAVSKRIAALERHIEVTLLVRTSRGSRLSLDGQVFLPHAKKVLAAIEQAEQAVRPGSRPLPLADAPWASPADLAGHHIWIPGIRPGTEWAAFYQALSEAFGLSIDGLGPNFGDEALMDALADSASLATLVGSGDRYLWPQTHDLRRIPLHDPTPVYPHVLLFRSGDQHPVLTVLRDHLRTAGPRTPHNVWAPAWVDR
ncbi:LysR family transcriptional regulator [Streptomyces angustmyceticus]|uniref:LysR family transcriptional regulator n=1 Tax=Streptomyces angustmyceticus TaxID=285578 RepID=UPI00142D6360|nr:LysR family transcriptional regulator [Streptomyces angustmyceticus]UAL67317.1 LysR family transcriptional regulator [Streptomyces angustmyceticus]